MEKKFDINVKGYSIRCRIIAARDARQYRRAVICTHGFGGSKDMANITHFAEKETSKYKGDAVICFDWPCHGQDARKKMDLAECMEYLAEVIRYAQEELGAESLMNYSVSLGAYLTLVYIHRYGNPFRRIALRSLSVDMYALMREKLTEDELAKVEKGKEVLVGFDRKMKMDRQLLADLAEADIREYEYFDWADDIMIIQGTKDTTVSFDDARAFAENNVIEFMPVEGADHTFRSSKYMDQAVHAILEFFA